MKTWTRPQRSAGPPGPPPPPPPHLRWDEKEPHEHIYDAIEALLENEVEIGGRFEQLEKGMTEIHRRLDEITASIDQRGGKIRPVAS